MTRRVTLTLIAGLLFAQSLSAAGSVTLSSAVNVGWSVARYTYTWTSSAGGAVSGDTTTIAPQVEGYLLRVELVPASGGTQPTDLYDLTLLDGHGIDVLQGTAANLSNVNGTLLAGLGIWLDRQETLQLVIANAGNAKSGTVILWVGRP